MMKHGHMTYRCRIEETRYSGGAKPLSRMGKTT